MDNDSILAGVAGKASAELQVRCLGDYIVFPQTHCSPWL